MVAVPGFVLLTFDFWSFGDRISGWARLPIESPYSPFALSTFLFYRVVSLIVFLLATLRAVTFVSCIGIVVAMAAISFKELRTNIVTLIGGVKDVPWKGLVWFRGGWQGWAPWLSCLILLLGLVQCS